MFEYTNSKARSVIGPRSEVLTRDKLPPANTTRWMPNRKAQVVAAVQGGLITIDEALVRYNLSLQEFYSWQQAMDRAGVGGLSQSALQHERHQRRVPAGIDAARAVTERHLTAA